MKIKFEKDLLLICLLALLLLALVSPLPDSMARAVFGVILATFSPGYAILAALFPRKNDLNLAERLALSVMVSLLAAVFFGYLSNFAPWGIRLYPVVLFLVGVVIVSSAIAWLRRRRLPLEERPVFETDIPLPNWRGFSRLEKTLSIILVVAVLATLGSMGYVLAVPGPQEHFTEFYILGAKDKIGDYPLQLKVGEKGTVTLIAVNHEKATTSYLVKISLDDDVANISELGPVVLGDGKKWQEAVSFAPARTGSQRIEFTLYKVGVEQPYRQLFLNINVVPGA